MPTGRGTGEERPVRAPSRNTEELLGILERSRTLTGALKTLAGRVEALLKEIQV